MEEQQRILELILQNKTNKEISIELNYSRSTVKRRIKELFKMYNVDSRIKLMQEYLMERLT